MKQKRQSQDKPQTKIRVARKRARLTELFSKGKTLREAGKILRDEGFEKGTSLATLHDDLQIIKGDFADRLPEERERALTKLKSWMNDLEADGTLRRPEQIAGCLAVYDRLARLLGLDAPTKSVKVNVDGGSPEQLIGYRRFVAECQSLSPEDLEKVYVFARSLRKPRVLDAAIAVLEESEGGDGVV
jgi:hypothetical protein